MCKIGSLLFHKPTKCFYVVLDLVTIGGIQFINIEQVTNSKTVPERKQNIQQIYAQRLRIEHGWEVVNY